MSIPAHHITAPPSLAAQIAQLPNLSMAQIKALWNKIFDNCTPTHNRRFLERRIAYRLQELELDKTDSKLLESNRRRIAELAASGKPNGRGRDYRLAPGTLFTRQYQGVEHCVRLTADGQYDYRGRMYPSLSMIARQITGTRWSGPLFFGLKDPAKPAGRKGARR